VRPVPADAATLINGVLQAMKEVENRAWTDRDYATWGVMGAMAGILLPTLSLFSFFVVKSAPSNCEETACCLVWAVFFTVLTGIGLFSGILGTVCGLFCACLPDRVGLWKKVVLLIALIGLGIGLALYFELPMPCDALRAM
jgi:uncharacterized membrane protein